MRHFWRFYFFKILLGLVVIELIYFVWLQYRNYAPVATEDKAIVYNKKKVKIDVLKNDLDKNKQDTLRIADIEQPLHGTYININDSLIEYTSNTGFIGSDSFKYAITDGKNISEPAYIKVKVEENKAPVPKNDKFEIFPWIERITLPVMSNDIDAEEDSIFIKNYTQPVHGKVWLNASELNYSLLNSNAKIDSFNYTLSDGSKESVKATVVVKIKSAKSSVFCSTPFYGDLRNYEQHESTKWDIINDNNNLVLCINTSSYPILAGDRAGAYCLVKNRLFTDDINIKFRVKCTDNLQYNQLADYTIYFAFVDYMNYCYVSFSSHEEGDGYTGIYKIVNGKRVAVACGGQAITDNEYHHCELIKEGNKVTVKKDGKILCQAIDKVFGIPGKIGIGSFNDMANFDDIIVTGKHEVK